MDDIKAYQIVDMEVVRYETETEILSVNMTDKYQYYPKTLGGQKNRSIPWA